MTFGYGSPRWTGEILDCAMPVTFDQYNRCAGNCLYCFSFFQKNLKQYNQTLKENKSYQKEELRTVNPKKVKKIFNQILGDTKYEDAIKPAQQFWHYIKQRRVVQWGGLADPFCHFEKKHEVGLELLEFFDKIDYPLSFSTKFVWWLEDERYKRLFAKHDNWHVKFSIINLDANKAAKIELGVPSPQRRLEGIKMLNELNDGGISLRLRPFIIGYSNPDHKELIPRAAENGADAVSMEFFCCESRGTDQRERYDKMSKVLGFDLFKYYRRNTLHKTGYLRLNWKIKEPYVLEAKKLAHDNDMRFYVSDAHWKDQSDSGNCCGLSPDKYDWNEGQFTEVLVKAKKRKDGLVYWSDMEMAEELFDGFLWRTACGFNTSGTKARLERSNQTMYDYIHEIWNSPNSAKSPYKYFQGLLKPVGKDDNGDIIYKYNPYHKTKKRRK